MSKTVTIRARFGKHENGTKHYVILYGSENCNGFAIWGGKGRTATYTNYRNDNLRDKERAKSKDGYKFTDMLIDVNVQMGSEPTLQLLVEKFGFKGARPSHSEAPQHFVKYMTKVVDGFGHHVPTSKEAPKAKEESIYSPEAVAQVPNWGAF